MGNVTAVHGSTLLSGLFRNCPDYRLTSRLFLRLLALVYLIAFASLYVQIPGLAGPNGILPFTHVLADAYQMSGWRAWLQLPNIFWLDASDAALLGAVAAGCLCSVLLFLGLFEQSTSIILFVLYLSLYHAGQIFLSFQWDSLLLEAGFLAIFLVSGPTPIVLLMYEWLLFRFRFMSGLSKLLSGDPSWAHFTALNYYFETQPLPHAGAWYAQLLPHWLDAAGVGFTFFTELLVPFMIFMPRRFRIAAALITVFMQLLIIATSNHAFVNVLVIVLCVLLLDDRVMHRLLPPGLLRRLDRDAREPGWLKTAASPIAAVLIVFVSTTSYYMYATQRMLPGPLVRLDDAVQTWGIAHIYHIYPTMPTERQELIIQGSRDGRHWKDYEFRYKPGPLDERPAFIVPYHPRLDWMMWFVPTQSGPQMYWFRRFMNRLKKGTPEVLALLKSDPFPRKPPRFLRVQVYDYRFTTAAQRARTGNWWTRKYLGVFPYVPPRRP